MFVTVSLEVVNRINLLRTQITWPSDIPRSVDRRSYADVGEILFKEGGLEKLTRAYATARSEAASWHRSFGEARDACSRLEGKLKRGRVQVIGYGVIAAACAVLAGITQYRAMKAEEKLEACRDTQDQQQMVGLAVKSADVSTNVAPPVSVDAVGNKPVSEASPLEIDIAAQSR